MMMNEDQTSATIHANDVLLGRGGATNNNEGNRRFRSLVKSFQADYLTARKKDKILIAHRIVALIHDKGGRFLKRGAGHDSWVEVPNKRAQEKTSQALREGLDVRSSTLAPRASSSSPAASRPRPHQVTSDSQMASRVYPTMTTMTPSSRHLDYHAISAIPDLRDEYLRYTAAVSFLYSPPPLNQKTFENAYEV